MASGSLWLHAFSSCSSHLAEILKNRYYFSITSSICRISKVYFFAKVYTFSIKYILFKKSILPTSLVARALSNHFLRKIILLRKGSCSRPSLDLAPCRLVVSVSGATCAPAIIFLFPRVTTTAVCLSLPPGTTMRKYIPLSKTG